MKRRRRIGAAAAVALLALAFTVAAGRPLHADEIRLWSGDPRTDVTVLEENCEAVLFRMKGVQEPQNYPAARVRAVIYHRRCEKYDEALRIARSGPADAATAARAAELLGALAADPPKAFPWVRQYTLFELAAGFERGRRWDDALGAWRNLLAQVPRSRFLGDAWEGISRCEEALGRPAEARKAAELLASEVAAKKLGPRWQLRAELRALELAAPADPNAATIGLLSLADRTGEWVDVGTAARLRAGTLLLEQAEFERARACFDLLLQRRQGADPATVAAAWNGLGRSLVTRPEPTAADWQEALFPFLRVVFHHGEELAGSELLAEALYWSARCLEARGGEVDRERARLLDARCAKEFPASPWTRAAQKK